MLELENTSSYIFTFQQVWYGSEAVGGCDGILAPASKLEQLELHISRACM
jgi:hypothetical protein